MDKTNYREVCSGKTGHAEACRIEFDPGVVKYGELVGEYAIYVMIDSCLTTDPSEFFYRTHDPTQLNAQGNDHGTRTFLAGYTPPCTSHHGPRIPLGHLHDR